LFSGVDVNLHAPLTFQSLITLSDSLEIICILSDEKPQESTYLVCPTNLSVVIPFLRSQSLKDLSHDDDKK
jgi:hypothetical protein